MSMALALDSTFHFSWRNRLILHACKQLWRKGESVQLVKIVTYHARAIFSQPTSNLLIFDGVL